jgi:hypothetical protein
MPEKHIHTLRRNLEDAQEIATLLSDEPRTEPAGTGYLTDPDESLGTAIDRIAGHDGEITMFVGAGVSTEAGLPSWTELVAGLLKGVAGDLDEDDRSRWLALTLKEGPLAAAAIAQALYPDPNEFRRALRNVLYRGRRPAEFLPGALAAQLAWLKKKLGSRLRLLTANYDGLLEAAMREIGLDTVSYVRARKEPEDKHAVWHLHGRMMQNPAGSGWLSEGQFVLAEGDYARSSYVSWPQQYVGELLKSSLCVFIGLSMTDPNFVRWLYRYGPDTEFDHLAIFVRQSSPVGDGAVRKMLERAAAARWARSRVLPVWTNYYGEVAQLVHEVGLKQAGAASTSFAARAVTRHELGQDLIVPEDQSGFIDAQEDINKWLRDRLTEVRGVARGYGVDLDGEDLGLGFWGADHERGVATLWATSDYMFTDRDALEERPIHVASRWIGVEAIMRGVPLEDDPAVYTTRWHFIRGIPIMVDTDGERSIAGAVTLTSATPVAECLLSVERAPSGLLREIDRMLGSSAAGFFTA